MISIILFHLKIFFISIILAANPYSLEYLLYNIDNYRWSYVIRMATVYYVWNLSILYLMF